MREPSDEELRSLETSELDSLMATVQKRVDERRTQKLDMQRMKTLLDKHEALAKFDPAKWQMKANVKLYRSGEFVGLFHDLRYPAKGSPRWLKRAEERDMNFPMTSEVLSGPWPAHCSEPHHAEADRTVQTFLPDVEIPHLGVHAVNVRLLLTIAAGDEFIRSASLLHVARFVSPDGKTIYYLPEGLDIYASLSEALKTSLWSMIHAETEAHSPTEEANPAPPR